MQKQLNLFLSRLFFSSLINTDMKAIILTFAPVTEQEKELLINTNILKMAINQHAEELKPTKRICSDYGVAALLLQRFPQDVITLRDWSYNDRLIYAGHINFKGSTIVATIEYLISEGYDDILIIGDNTVHSDIFKERVIREIDNIQETKPYIKIFQYRNGNFNLPMISVKEFIERSL